MKDIPRTMVHVLHEQAAQRRDRPALWTKRNGVYLPISWREYALRVKHFALGLQTLGFRAGDPMGIMSFNREEWLVADLAAMALGGVPAGIYTTSSPEQIRFIVGHCEAPVVVVENDTYLQKVLSVSAQLPKLKHIIVMDPSDTSAVTGPRGVEVLSYREVMERGREQPESKYQESVDALELSGLATLIYTSGTTGEPKAVMLSHDNIAWTATVLSDMLEITADEILLSYLPLSHVAEQVCSIFGPLMNGFQVYFAESFEKLPENLREVRPTAFFGVPRVWEKFKAKAEAGMKTLPPQRKAALAWARAVTAERHRRVLEEERAPMWLELQYQLARKLILGKLHARIGLDRARLLVTSAAPIGRDVLDFFISVDLVVREVYGQSEVTAPTTVNTPKATRVGTLGRPIAGIEVRIAEDGEILVRGPNVCMGYYKDPQATAELLEGGWMHSGDTGEFDGDGFLRITGRKKELIVTSGGKKTAPAHIEGLLKSIPPIGNAVVIGDRRNYLVALLALDAERVASWAAEKGFPTRVEDLVRHDGFLRYIDERIEQDVNRRVAKFESIKRFTVLPHEFTVEGGELTSTLKVRRKVVEEKYRSQIDALYAEARSA